MARRSGAELVREARDEMGNALSFLALGELKACADAARRAFAIARAQRSHRLICEAWVTLLEALGADPDNDLTLEYREFVEGAFTWGETMPDEIQIWFLLALEPHLEALGFRRLVERARKRRASAAAFIERGGTNSSALLQGFHLDDLAAGRTIDRKALALERTAAFYADELFEGAGVMLERAADAWRDAGRPDRAAFVADVAARVRSF